jgi:hypothetical protein
MKSFKEVISENKDHPELVNWAKKEYERVSYDLPRSGRGHYDAAHDHVADRLSEKFHKTHPNVNFRSVAKKALKDYADDDRKETRSYYQKLDRHYAAKAKPPKIKKVKQTWWQEMGYNKKPIKGIGSL